MLRIATFIGGAIAGWQMYPHDYDSTYDHLLYAIGAGTMAGWLVAGVLWIAFFAWSACTRSN